MNRIDKTLKALEQRGQKALSPYITAGDPRPEDTVKLMHALVEGGADILEVGIPFSDPMAEGPVIQHAMERALDGGMTTARVLQLIKQFRDHDEATPVILMGYLNPLEQYGYEQFAKDAARAGVDGTIIVDLPPEESENISQIWEQAGLYAIYLCSPTTTEARMAEINRHGRGYLYYVSLKGVTGSSAINLKELEQLYQQRKKQTSLPLMVGFGIKSADMAAQVGQFADGVIVGAALIETVFKAYQQQQDHIAMGGALIGQMRQAMNQ